MPTVTVEETNTTVEVSPLAPDATSLRGHSIATADPAEGDVLLYDGAEYTPHARRTFDDPIRLPSGTPDAPVLTPTGDADTGLYYPAPGEVAIRAGTDASGNAASVRHAAGVVHVGEGLARGDRVVLHEGGARHGALATRAGGMALTAPDALSVVLGGDETALLKDGTLALGSTTGRTDAFARLVIDGGGTGGALLEVRSRRSGRDYTISLSGFYPSLNYNIYREAATGDDVYATVGTAYKFRQHPTTGLLLWDTAPEGQAGDPIAMTTRMTLTPAGDLGIGTASPTERLHVAGGALRVDGRQYLGTPASAPADADLDPGQVSLWLDEAANELQVRAKKSDGVLLSGTVALA